MTISPHSLTIQSYWKGLLTHIYKYREHFPPWTDLSNLSQV